MPIEWLVPLVTIGYENRKNLGQILKGGLSFVLGKKTTLAFTGTQGVGKSVLYDHLSGTAFKQGYEPPLQSQKKETGKIKVKGPDGKKRLIVSVVPGQANSAPRFEALEQVFDDQETDGVIHLVGNGFAVTRKQDAIDYLVNEGKLTTVEEYRNYQLRQELADLNETCDRIVESHHKRRSPKWMIVVSGKVDLYSSVEEVEAARRYYSSSGDSLFSLQLKALQSRVGTNFIRFDAAPASCIPEDFEWNGDIVKSQISTAARDEFLGQLLQLIANYSK